LTLLQLLFQQRILLTEWKPIQARSTAIWIIIIPCKRRRRTLIAGIYVVVAAAAAVI